MVHHQDGNCKNHLRNNLALLHRHCHDLAHRGLRDKQQFTDEPDEVKVCAVVRTEGLQKNKITSI